MTRKGVSIPESILKEIQAKIGSNLLEDSVDKVRVVPIATASLLEYRRSYLKSLDNAVCVEVADMVTAVCNCQDKGALINKIKKVFLDLDIPFFEVE